MKKKTLLLTKYDNSYRKNIKISTGKKKNKDNSPSHVNNEKYLI